VAFKIEISDSQNQCDRCKLRPAVVILSITSRGSDGPQKIELCFCCIEGIAYKSERARFVRNNPTAAGVTEIEREEYLPSWERTEAR
jgi:hypothetical protein